MDFLTNARYLCLMLGDKIKYDDGLRGLVEYCIYDFRRDEIVVQPYEKSQVIPVPLDFGEALLKKTMSKWIRMTTEDLLVRRNPELSKEMVEKARKETAGTQATRNRSQRGSVEQQRSVEEPCFGRC